MFNRKEYMEKYWIRNKEKLTEQKRKYYEKNHTEILKKCKQYRDNHKEQIKKTLKRWREVNPKKIRQLNNRWKKEQRKTNLKYSLNKKISETIRTSLKGNKNGRHWENLVGYTLNDLVKRLKKTIPKCYVWQDFLEGKLHIDHKIPISAFHFTKPEHTDFKRCWALSNLQLLSIKENLIKGNKITKPFQPALKI